MPHNLNICPMPGVIFASYAARLGCNAKHCISSQDVDSDHSLVEPVGVACLDALANWASKKPSRSGENSNFRGSLLSAAVQAFKNSISPSDSIIFNDYPDLAILVACLLRLIFDKYKDKENTVPHERDQLLQLTLLFLTPDQRSRLNAFVEVARRIFANLHQSEDVLRAQLIDKFAPILFNFSVPTFLPLLAEETPLSGFRDLLLHLVTCTDNLEALTKDNLSILRVLTSNK
ncbi:hypothetical protein Ciccas_007293 [Cichlidogyrus casuarinus]|uniref:Uncharacterized protein n=1 Tax=Cichlidogyrus casuarinus TaxID=1844966 RepID=A0ABD2Q3B7_9PLAT